MVCWSFYFIVICLVKASVSAFSAINSTAMSPIHSAIITIELIYGLALLGEHPLGLKSSVESYVEVSSSDSVFEISVPYQKVCYNRL